MPDGVEDGVLAGMYCLHRSPRARINLLGSGAIMTEVLTARELLEDLGHPVNVWSVTSYTELAREAIAIERRNLMSRTAVPERPYVTRLLEPEEGVFVAASDYMKALPLGIAPWVPGPFVVLGTDGYGLSEGRPELRNHFEVSAAWIAYAALRTLAVQEGGELDRVIQFAVDHALELDKADPAGFVPHRVA
jgi:pyruvate dehydrogenase E1 component